MTENTPKKINDILGTVTRQHIGPKKPAMVTEKVTTEAKWQTAPAGTAIETDGQQTEAEEEE